jgi:hypothetical protein
MIDSTSTLPLEGLRVYSRRIGGGYYLRVAQGSTHGETWVEYSLTPNPPPHTAVAIRCTTIHPPPSAPTEPAKPDKRKKRIEGFSHKRRIPLKTQQGRNLFQSRQARALQSGQLRPDQFLRVKQRSSNRARTRSGSFKRSGRCE